MARRKGRIIAFQALYSWNVNNEPKRDLLELNWVEPDTLKRMGDDSITFTKLLISGTMDHIAEIDATIEKYLTNWTIDRINKVDLAVMRLSVYQLLYQKDIHPSIIIDEAVDIAKEFGSDDSFKFVNAVLDNIKKDLEK